jgi:hypothetical protein
VIQRNLFFSERFRINEHAEHKGRQIDSVTFAAPVFLNGIRGNVAVCVTYGKGNVHSIRALTPNGKAFEFYEMKKADIETGSSPKELTSGGIPIESASANSIPNSVQSVKQKNSHPNGWLLSFYIIEIMRFPS